MMCSVTKGCPLRARAQLQLNTGTKRLPVGFPVVLRWGQGMETPLCSGFTQRRAVCPADHGAVPCVQI